MTWTPDRPTKPGKYWLSVHPESRTSNGMRIPHTLLVEVDSGGSVEAEGCSDWSHLVDPMLDGALWLPYVEPPDPFAEPVPQSSEFKAYRLSDDPMTPNLRLILDADVGIVTLYEADMTSRSDTAQETERHDKIVMSPDDARWLRDQLVALLESEGM